MIRWYPFLLLVLFFWFLHARPARADGWQVLERTEQNGAHEALSHAQLRVAIAGSNRQVSVDIVQFDDRKLRLEIVDNAVEPRLKLAQAMRNTGAVAGANGGFFHPDFRPAGMIVSQGKTIAQPEKASLLSGAVVSEPSGAVRVLRYRELGNPEQWSAGIQAGPFLIDGGTAVQGLKDGHRARRTIFATDGRHRHALILTGPLTLQEAAAMLAAIELSESLEIARALNLDGGSSSGIWVAQGEDHAYYQAEWGHVRNFLALFPR